VLRPGGPLHFAEHGRSLTPGGPLAGSADPAASPPGRRCHLDRPISKLVADCDLTLTALDTYYMKGPKPVGYPLEGRALCRRLPAGTARHHRSAGEHDIRSRSPI
jgi:hypothetical protein